MARQSAFFDADLDEAGFVAAVLEDVLFDDEALDDVVLALDELELFADDGLAAAALSDELVLFFADDFELGFFEADALAWLRGLRAVRTGRFQPAALSARNVRGMAITFSGLSTTDATAASARSARTSEITLAGRRARAAWTRFVSSRTNICRSGSIQIDVPV